MKREHRYRITLEHLSGPKEETPLNEPLSFETGNHDDLFVILDRALNKGILDAENARSLALGLKLFTEVMLKNRDEPIFEDIRPAMRAFIKQWKALGKEPKDK